MPAFIATLPNTDAGKVAIKHLRDFGEPEFHCRYLISLSDYLTAGPEPRLNAGNLLAELPHTFHLIEIFDNDAAPWIVKLLRWHSDPTGRQERRGHIEAIEPNIRLNFSGIGLPFTPDGKFDDYLKRLNVDQRCNYVGNEPVEVALLDTGSSGLKFVSDFYDLTNYATGFHPGLNKQVDTDGHGTAMATLIHAVAPGATLRVIRIAVDEPEYMHVLAGVAVAVADCHAEIVNLSLGFSSFGSWCGGCETGPIARSIAFQKLFAMLIGIDLSNRPNLLPPIFVAATGNAEKRGDPTKVGFDYPGALESTIAVGAVNSRDRRSSFSKYGTPHPAYLLAPGGEDSAGFEEEAGHGSGGRCFGTSVSAAYVTGIFALMRQDSRFRGLGREDLIQAALGCCQSPSAADRAEYGHGIIRYPCQ